MPVNIHWICWTGMWTRWRFRTSRRGRCGTSCATVGWVTTVEMASLRKCSMLQRTTRLPASGGQSKIFKNPFYWLISANKSVTRVSLRNIFQSRTSTGFRDEHIWVSIVDPPSRSPFTRAQRVSCCMSLLLCTMAINIAFWNIPVDEKSPVLFSIGDLQSLNPPVWVQWCFISVYDEWVWSISAHLLSILESSACVCAKTLNKT